MEELRELVSLSVNCEDFDEVFCQLKHDFSLELANENKLEIFHLKKENRGFNYDALIGYCLGNLSQYVFSRKEIEKVQGDISAIQKLFKKAIERFRILNNDKDKGAGGELGEILLYLFLENRLKAPKLLSKMEIKTTNNQYVYGADGIHFYSTLDADGDPIYQFVIGEAKVKNDILDATREAFDSIMNTLDEIDIEKGLISMEIFKEICDEEKAKALMELIIPAEDITEKTSIHEKALGIFIGYSVDYEENISNKEWNIKVEEKIKADILRAVETMKKRIVKHGLRGYSTYCYFMPFNKADEDRISIMKKIL